MSSDHDDAMILHPDSAHQYPIRDSKAPLQQKQGHIGTVRRAQEHSHPSTNLHLEEQTKQTKQTTRE